MPKEEIMLTGWGEVQLYGCIWRPEAEAKAVLQIIHGMTEHMGRYEAFAADLCSQGIAVAGFDLRGHGRNPGNPEVASCAEGGWAASVEDVQLFAKELRQRFPETPHYMLGFSLGSFLLREYLTKYSGQSGLSGAIIAGTGHQPGWLLAVMMAIVKGEMKKAGFDGTTALVRKLSFETYNQKFKPNRTSADWLCGDTEELDKYLSDPLVRKDISAGLFRELLGSMKRGGKVESFAAWNKDLPVLLLYGSEDPVGNGGKGVMQLYTLLKKSGHRQLACQRFPGARHDIFHEVSNGTAETLRHCVVDFLEE